jgi:hypothetical protein
VPTGFSPVSPDATSTGRPPELAVPCEAAVQALLSPSSYISTAPLCLAGLSSSARQAAWPYGILGLVNVQQFTPVVVDDVRLRGVDVSGLERHMSHVTYVD